MSYTVYKHTSPRGKVYIGITARPPSRRWHGGSAYRNNAHFYAAIKKYGWDGFSHDIIAAGLEYEDACRLEIELIEKHDSTDPSKGYNISRGGDKTTLGYPFSEETRRKIGQSNKGKTKGRPFTKEHRERISASLMGHTCTDETRDKLRSVLGDRFKTPEAIQKQKENTPRGAQHHGATAVVCIDTGERFETIQQAAGHRWAYATIEEQDNGREKKA